MTPAVSVVIPLYNEVEAFSVYGPALLHELAKTEMTWELILVVNGCTDGTREACETLWSRCPLAAASDRRGTIRVVVCATNQGYGGGIIEGLKVATGDVVGYSCGDGQVSAADLVRCMHKALDGTGLVKGTRDYRHDGWWRRLQSSVFNSVVYSGLRIASTDINATPKFWPRRWGIVLESKDWFIDVELMLRVFTGRGLSPYDPLREVPIVYYPRLAGRSRVGWRTALEFIRNIYRCRRDGRYARWTAR